MLISHQHRQKGYDVVLLDSPIDSHFINQLEQKLEKTNMKRVDARHSGQID